MILTKILGMGCVLFGLAMIVFFPYTQRQHQPAWMGNAGIVVGIVFLGIGLLLLKV